MTGSFHCINQKKKKKGGGGLMSKSNSIKEMPLEKKFIEDMYLE